ELPKSQGPSPSEEERIPFLPEEKGGAPEAFSLQRSRWTFCSLARCSALQPSGLPVARSQTQGGPRRSKSVAASREPPVWLPRLLRHGRRSRVARHGCA